MLHEIDFGLKLGELSVQATQKHFHHLMKLVFGRRKFLLHFSHMARAIMLLGELKLQKSVGVMLLVFIFEC